MSERYYHLTEDKSSLQYNSNNNIITKREGGERERERPKMTFRNQQQSAIVMLSLLTIIALSGVVLFANGQDKEDSCVDWLTVCVCIHNHYSDKKCTCCVT